MSTLERAFRYSVLEVLISLVCGDVHVVGFDADLRVDEFECLFGCICFGEPHLHGSEKQPVHVGELYFIVVVEYQFAHSASGQHLRGDWPDAAHSDNENCFGLNFSIVLHNAHLFQGHESAVWVVIFDLFAHSIFIIRFCYDIPNFRLYFILLWDQLLQRFIHCLYLQFYNILLIILINY